MKLYVDEEYRTGLGTGFYNRVEELGRLERLLDGFRIVIVYGPRGVGKSELVRYWLHRAGRGKGVTAVHLDARRLGGRELVEALEAWTPGFDAGTLVKRLLEMLGELGEYAPLVRLVPRVFETAARLARTSRSTRIVVFIDEFHMLPRPYVQSPLDDLEALAGLLVKDERYSRMSIVVTVSEGFAATDYAVSKLHGYSTAWMLVEHLDKAHFRALYEEYRGRRGCRLGADIVAGLVGGTPGALPELCSLDESGVIEAWIPVRVNEVEMGLSNARKTLCSSRVAGCSISPQELICMARRVMSEEVKPLEEPELHELGQVLTRFNIVYPVYPRGRGGIRYKPSYPVYRTIVELGCRRGARSLLELDPREVYEEAVRRAEKV